jgi:hypothetical protein
MESFNPTYQRLSRYAICMVLLFAWSKLMVAQQPSFIWMSDSLDIAQTYSTGPHYASGLTVRDFDSDGWDDIVFCTDENAPVIYYKNYYGTFEEVSPIPTTPEHGNYVVWIDYDNDGYLDYYESKDTAGVRLLKGDSTGGFTNVTTAVGLSGLNGVRREGGVFADLNNDGLLDLFIGTHSFNEANRLYLQTPQNTFHDISTMSGVCDTVDHTFHAVAIDYNNDGLLDLYEANDYGDGNRFFKNNGDSTFSEVSLLNGTYQELDAMGLGVGDFDGDLDFDIHITDRYVQSRLLRNNGDGTYTEVGVEHNLNYYNGFGWGNNFFDADLDGDNDIYISGMKIALVNGVPSLLYVNDGNAYFTGDTIGNDSLYSFSNAIFDFNNDRLPDLTSQNSENNPFSIWQNTTPTTTPRFSIKLEGCTSNRDAVGAQIFAYDGPDARAWMVHSTQSFMSQNTDKQIIPILNGQVLDSLKIIWPLGNDTTLYSIQPDQTINLSECGEAAPHAVILVDDYIKHGLVLCTGDSIVLRLDGNYNNVIWSTGATEDSIVVYDAGVYNVTVTNQWGSIRASTKAVTVESRTTPTFNTYFEHPNCFNNGMIGISDYEGIVDINFTWDVGIVSDSLFDLSPGTYSVTIDNGGFCPVVEQFELNGPDSLNPITTSIHYPPIPCKDSTTLVTVEGSGGYGPLSYTWSNGSTGNNQFLSAGTYTLTVTDPQECSINTSFTLMEPSALFVWAESIPDTNDFGVGKAWVEIDGGTSPYHTTWDDENNQIGDTAYGLLPGAYSAYVEDLNGCTYTRNIAVGSRIVIGISENESTRDVTCRWVHNDRIDINGLQHKQLEHSVEVFDLLGRPLPFEWTLAGPGSISVFSPYRGIQLIRIDDKAVCKIVSP